MFSLGDPAKFTSPWQYCKIFFDQKVIKNTFVSRMSGEALISNSVLGCSRKLAIIV